jgi:hypothetical protein
MALFPVMFAFEIQTGKAQAAIKNSAITGVLPLSFCLSSMGAG